MKLNIKRIKYEMKLRGWQIEDLAGALDLKERAVYTIFKKQTTKLKTIEKLGKTFDIDPRELLT